MPRHVAMIWAWMSRRLRSLERELESAHQGNRIYSWGLPAIALVLCFTILAVAGFLSGVPIVQFLPIAVFEGLVMAGLFIACMMPSVSPPDDRPDRGPDDDPPPTPPPSDPSIWVRLLEDANIPPRSASDVEERAGRELVGAPR
jgi:hypothetical protein